MSRLATRIEQAVSVGARLVLARELAGLTRPQAVRLLGWCSPRGLSALEADEHRPNDDEILQIAELYAVCGFWLRTGRGRVVVIPAGLARLDPLDAADVVALVGILR